MVILDIMKEHELDRIFLDTGWELKINGDYKNPHSSNPNFRAGKIKGLKVINKEGESGKVGYVMNGINSRYNSYYINPHKNPFNYLRNTQDVEGIGLLTINLIEEYLTDNEIDLSIFNLEPSKFKNQLDDLKSRKLSFKKGVVFLSHSYKDWEIVKRIAVAFILKGYDPFLDWLDNRLINRNRINREGVEIIKEKIEKSSMFVYIASKGHGISKWMPWELGISYGLRNEMYILPTNESEVRGGYKGQEYLAIHDHLVFSEEVFKKFPVNESLEENRKGYIL